MRAYANFRHPRRRCQHRTAHRSVRTDHALGGSRRRICLPQLQFRGICTAAARRSSLRRRSPVPSAFSTHSSSSGSVNRNWRSLQNFSTNTTVEWLRNYRFSGDIDGYREGDFYFPRITDPFGPRNFRRVRHPRNLDSLDPQPRQRDRFGRSPHGERSGRSTDDRDGLASYTRTGRRRRFTCRLSRRLRRHLQPRSPRGVTTYPAQVPARTPSTLLHTTEDGPDEAAAFRGQVAALGVSTTLLVDTYDITEGVKTAVAVAGPELGGVRIDSGDLGVLARQVRQQLDDLGATKTRIVVSGDLDEYAIAALRAEPVDSLRASVLPWSPDQAPPPQAWFTSWSRSTESRSRREAPTRHLAAAPRRHCA